MSKVLLTIALAGSFGAWGCRDVADIEELQLTPIADAGADADDKPDAGCGDVLTDAKNCGACGHDCLGATCADGLCAPEELTSAPLRDIGYLALSVRGTKLYAATFDEIVECEANSCDSTVHDLTFLTEPETVYASVDFEEDGVYYSTEAATTKVQPTGVIALKASGAAPKVLVNGVSLVFGLTKFGDQLYWSDEGDASSNSTGTLSSCTLPDCKSPRTIETKISAVGPVVATASSVYYEANGTVHGRSVGGLFVCNLPSCSDGAKLLDPTQSFGSVATQVIFDGKDFYFGDGMKTGSLWSLDLKGTPTRLGKGRAYALAKDEHAVYWADADDDQIWKVSLDTPHTPPVLLASGQTNPSVIAVDPTWVYWGNSGDLSVKRTPK